MKLKHTSFRIRAYLIYLLFLAVAVVVSGRLFTLQIRDHAEYQARAESQQQHTSTIEAERGKIVLIDRDGVLHPVATNKQFPYVYIVPKDITDPERVARGLAGLVNVSQDIILRRASKPNDPYELIARRISPEVAAEIKSLGLEGTHIGMERLRFYPMGNIAADTVGFAIEEDNPGRLVGKYGIEVKFDEFLRGRPGAKLNIRDGAGNVFMQFQNSLPVAGSTVVLTLDPNVQFRAEELLAEAAQRWNSRSGTIIAMNAKTGEVLALANWPTFDLNKFSQVRDTRVFANQAISSRFEPGSVFKPITKAIALERQKITPETTYNDTGSVVIGGHAIRNADRKAHGRTTMTRALAQSYNLGAVFAADLIGHEKFREFLTHTFRLGDVTGIDLPGEVRGDLSGLWPPHARPINFATASFGQGIAVTPMKLMETFGAFANGGDLIRPRLISSIQRPDGREERSATRVTQGRILSEATLSDLRQMMVASIEDGFARRARIPGYTVAGKTGTAQIPDPAGGYSDEITHTFIAFTPYTNPPLVVMAKLERPIGVRFAVSSVLPVVRDLMRFMLQYYSIAPDRPEELFKN